MSLTISAFIERWKGSAGNERANKDSFLRDLCEALDLPIPEPKDAFSSYCFEKDLKITHLDGMTSTGSIDLFRETCFVMEAKQGSTKAKPGSSPIRGTRAYDQYMEKAFGQAVNYAIRLPQRPPFVLTCDIGHSFHIWEGFSGTYGGYGARKSIPLEGLRDPDVQSLFRAIWLDPQSLNPARLRALVTRTVAKELGHLAAGLEKRFPAQSVADFLMRCVFTFFAEDVGLLPAKEFEEALDQWRKDPSDFVPGLSSMWEAGAGARQSSSSSTAGSLLRTRPLTSTNRKSSCFSRQHGLTGVKWIRVSLGRCWRAPCLRMSATDWEPTTRPGHISSG